MKAWMVFLLLIPGCFEPQEQLAQVDPFEYGRIAGIAGLVCSFEDDSSPSPSPSPSPRPGDTCPTCKGSGKVGDKTVFSKCLDCDGTGKVLAQEIREQPSSDKEENATSGKGRPGAQTYSAAYTAALRDGKPLVVLISGSSRKPLGGDFDGGGVVQSQMKAVLAGIDLSGVHFAEVISSSPDGLRLWSGHYSPQLLIFSRSPEGKWRKTKADGPASQIMEAISNAKQHSLQRSSGASTMTPVVTTSPVYQIQTRRRIFRRR